MNEKSQRERLQKQIAILCKDYEEQTGYQIEKIEISRFEVSGPPGTGELFQYKSKVKVD